MNEREPMRWDTRSDAWITDAAAAFTWADPDVEVTGATPHELPDVQTAERQIRAKGLSAERNAGLVGSTIAAYANYHGSDRQIVARWLGISTLCLAQLALEPKPAGGRRAVLDAAGSLAKRFNADADRLVRVLSGPGPFDELIHDGRMIEPTPWKAPSFWGTRLKVGDVDMPLCLIIHPDESPHDGTITLGHQNGWRAHHRVRSVTVQLDHIQAGVISCTMAGIPVCQPDPVWPTFSTGYGPNSGRINLLILLVQFEVSGLPITAQEIYQGYGEWARKFIRLDGRDPSKDHQKRIERCIKLYAAAHRGKAGIRGPSLPQRGAVLARWAQFLAQAYEVGKFGCTDDLDRSAIADWGACLSESRTEHIMAELGILNRDVTESTQAEIERRQAANPQ